MKRFVTYLYSYKDGQKMKNTGYIRVNVRANVLEMQMNIKDSELDDAKGFFYIIIKDEKKSKLLVEEIRVKNGSYRGVLYCDCNSYKEVSVGLENIIGVGIEYETGGYMASCWKDGEEELIASREHLKNDIEMIENTSIDSKEEKEVIMTEDTGDEEEENIQVASIENKGIFSNADENECEYEIEKTYRKINLNEIYTLPSSAWHYSNNSFLIHGFWNYGYLVLKETMEENQKRIALGIPGIFERPEMVMATFFGFSEFETLPSQAMEMEIGQCCSYNQEEKEQQPQEGTFGCWFVNL